jgi:hypothetical protein
MYPWQEKNIQINEESKIVIGLGDSFTQGQGACSPEVWQKYNWDIKKMYIDDNTDVLESFYENSWVTQLCKNHLTDYIPVNMGMAGKGNRAAVKELYLHPELGIEKAKEKIVVFVMSGYERFDFVHNDYAEHQHFTTMWPNIGEKIPDKALWEAYAEVLWNERFGLIELLLNIAEAKTWCKAHNAKFLLTAGFNTEIRRNVFIDKIRGDDEYNTLYRYLTHIEGLVDIINWEEFLYPKDFNCMSDYLLSLEERNDLIDPKTSWPFHEWSYTFNNFSPKGYISKDAHPSYLGHKEIAKVIYEQLNKLYNV